MHGPETVRPSFQHRLRRACLAGVVKALKTIGGAEKRNLEQQHNHTEFEREGVLGELDRAERSRIRNQRLAIGWLSGHCEEVKYFGIGATSVNDVACVAHEPSPTHGSDKAARTAKWPAHSRDPGEQWL